MANLTNHCWPSALLCAPQELLPTPLIGYSSGSTDLQSCLFAVTSWGGAA